MTVTCRLLGVGICMLTLCLFGTPPTSAQGFDWNNLEPGHWYEIPNTHLFDVAPDPCVHSSCDKVGNVTKAWSGGAYDTNRDWYIVWGGGHADYGGNEIYAFDVNALAWTRLTDPSYDLGGSEESGVYPDGTPRAVHTYGYITYVQNIDRFCTIGAKTLYPSGNASTDKVHCNDFDNRGSAKRGWEHRSTMPYNGTAGARAVYDTATGDVWYNGYGTRDYLIQWNPIADTWAVRTPEQSVSGTKLSAAIDPTRGVFVDIGEGVPAGYYDIRQSGTLSKVPLNSSGPSTVESAKAPGFEYDPVSDQFIGWSGGTSVYALDFDAREWKQCSPAGSNSVSPGSALTNGTYGRFQYIPSKNAFILINDVKENVFVYKLSSSCGGGPPDVTGPTVPQGLQATATGIGSIDLSWQAAGDPETGVPTYRVYRNGSHVGQSGNTSYTDTGLAEGTTYAYTVSAVNGGGLESAQSASASATTLADVTPPTLVSALSSADPNTVTVTFSEPVETGSASNGSNYGIDNGVTVSSAALGPDLVTVTLTTSALAENIQYTLTVSNVRDRATTPNTIAPGSTTTFEYLNVAIFELRIAAGGDDVEEDQDGIVGMSSSDLELVADAQGIQTVGLRFLALPIPQGATIANAYIQFETDEESTDAASLMIHAQASDDAPEFESSNNDVTSRPRTTTSSAWSPAPWDSVGEQGPAQRTPNIAPVLQEIVNRPGWSAGNALILIVSGTGTRIAEAYNGNTSGAAMLHVEYGAGAPPTDPPPIPGNIAVE